MENKHAARVSQRSVAEESTPACSAWLAERRASVGVRSGTCTCNSLAASVAAACLTTLIVMGRDY